MAVSEQQLCELYSSPGLHSWSVHERSRVEGVGDNLDALIQEVTVDAYGEDEQLWAFRQAFEDDGRFPFPALVVGTAVDVTAVDYEGDERRGLIALCWRDRKTHLISLLDIEPAGPLPLATARLLAAYRRWWGAEPLPVAAQEPRKQACEPPWDPWRLHRLERMMEPWQTNTPPRSGTRPS